MLVEIAYARLVGLCKCTQLDATRLMVGSKLFHQFLLAASAGGFIKEKKDKGNTTTPRGGKELTTVDAAAAIGDGEEAARCSSRKS